MKPSSLSSSLWIPISLAVALFLALGGFSVLVTSNTDWIMHGFLDPQANLFGWEYFRHTPWLQFPLGANPDYGMELGSSIVFSDSIPLFALPFKLLAPLLPETFQYFGLWVLTCMVLHAVFGYLLLSRFITSQWQLALGTALLLLLPPYLMRFTIHLALGGQWLLLAGLYLYFSPRYRATFWLLMLTLATLVHAYLLVMLAAIWGADLLQRLWARQLTVVQCLVRGLVGSAVIIGLMWILGYFMLGSAPTVSDPYGRMNLLSMVDPAGGWSTFFPDLRLTDALLDSDGFAYLGAGIIGLLAVACIVYFFTARRETLSMHTVWPITAIAWFLLLIALTNTIKLGNFTLIEFELPSWAVHVYQTFRSPGRFFWPVIYLVSAMAIIIACTRLPTRAATCLLVVALGLQIHDLSDPLQSIRDYFQPEARWTSPLSSPLWDELGEHYEKVIYIRPGNMPPYFIPMTEFAQRHGLPINSGYLARIDVAAEARARVALTEQVKTGNYDASALYVFNDEELWDMAIRAPATDDQAGTLDDVRLLLPEVSRCASCRHPDFRSQRWGLWNASQLPTIVGQVRNGALQVQPGQAGYLSFGPYTRIPAGSYRYLITYSADAPSHTVAGHWDIVSGAAKTLVKHASGELSGTDGEIRIVQGWLESAEDILLSEIRTFTNGVTAVSLISVELKQTGDDHDPAK